MKKMKGYEYVCKALYIYYIYKIIIIIIVIIIIIFKLLINQKYK